MQSRREFLKAAAALGSQSLVWGTVPDIIAKTLAINPELGTTFHDAEHVIVLMQENRSFDHAFGAMRGVRGFRDKRIHQMPNGHAAWFQPDTDGSIIPPFRLDMDGSNITWIGGTPHSWPDQVDARNGGRYDRWLPAKRRGDKFPMTMGFFTREDIPFYYAFADAFTVFDQAFCSSLTGTTPNRLFLWTGTIREDEKHPARVMNGDTDYDVEAAWTTYPERLEKAGVSWKIYQNEISLDSGFVGEEDAWLSNFTDNPIEWFTQYRVRFSKSRRKYVPVLIQKLEDSLKADQKSLSTDALNADDKEKLEKRIKATSESLASLKKEQLVYTDEAWGKLSEAERHLHEKAFCDNSGDPDFRTLVKHTYDDNGTARSISVPKGDVLHQFRQDVETNQLPAVSWLVAPERFSDHPGSAWFGAWYVSEVLQILTEDPERWKKTVLIICYDENDGYFDHVPPFVAPHPGRPETGKVSAGIDTTADVSDAHHRDHSIGLGYRCPLMIASPWSRGGCVNSQVSDHTSILMFLETWLAGKGKTVKEENISEWRRTVCGDLTSAFKPYNGEKYELPKYLERDAYIERIHKASFKSRPKPADKLSESDLGSFDIRAFQERGTRTACPLPYEMEASIEIVSEGAHIKMSEGAIRGKNRVIGAPFNAYSYGSNFVARAYAVVPGDTVEDILPVNGAYDVRIDGPNGFMRSLKSGSSVSFRVTAKQDGPDLILNLSAIGPHAIDLAIADQSYGQKPISVHLKSGEHKSLRVHTKNSGQWYDLAVSSVDTTYRFAGHLETGAWTTSDPAMG